MFLAVLFIVLGVFLLLNALGIVVGGSFWNLFLAVIFIAVGVKLLARKGKCPICGWSYWEGKIHGRIHEHMQKHADMDKKDEEKSGNS